MRTDRSQRSIVFFTLDILGAKGGKSLMNRGLDCFALTLVIIGAVNWGLIGFFQLDLVAWLFGNLSWISRIIYALVGLCGLYMISFYGHLSGE